MKKLILLGLVAASLVGCTALAPRPPRHVTLTTAFNPSQVAWFNQHGTGAITGQAFVQTRGGNPRTCAGNEVRLYPHSAYSDERLMALYGSTESGFIPVGFAGIQFSPESKAYQDTDRITKCDAQGNFTFSNLPTGNYFIVTGVAWSTRGGVSPDQGGGLMKSVVLGAGETKHVIITP